MTMLIPTSLTSSRSIDSFIMLDSDSCCRRYEFDYVEGPDAVGMATGATIHTANGLWMNIVRRKIPAQSSSTSSQAAELAPAR